MSNRRTISDIISDIKEVNIKISNWYRDWVGAERGSVWAQEEMASLRAERDALRFELRNA